jgi:hypothetical protein
MTRLPDPAAGIMLLEQETNRVNANENIRRRKAITIELVQVKIDSRFELFLPLKGMMPFYMAKGEMISPFARLFV